MYATLLLPAGITSRASVCYKDEGEMLEHVEDVDYAYIHEVLPEKMSYNLEDLRKYSLWERFYDHVYDGICSIAINRREKC